MSVLAAFESWLASVEDQVKSELGPEKVASACMEATKEIRKDIIQSWETYRWQSTDAATQYQQSVSNQSKGAHSGWSTSVITDSWVDGGSFFPYTSTVEKWEEHHYSLGGNDWILHLLFDAGVIGLPPKGAHGWVNDNFHIAPTPLESHFQSSGIWQTFESRVKARI